MTQSTYIESEGRFARISACGEFRYALGRTWDRRHGPLVFVCLNPSVADEHDDDPTIRRCVSFAKKEGYGGIEVVNLFAWRSTYPDRMRQRFHHGADVVGPENDQSILVACLKRTVCLAWGVVPSWAESRRDHVLEMFNVRRMTDLVVLGRTRDGHPRHPLYCPGDSRLQPFEIARSA